MKHCLVFASLISPSKMILFEKKYQTFDTVFHHQMKHLEVRQKYSAARRIFNSLLGVSSGDETLHLMFDILRKDPTSAYPLFSASCSRMNSPINETNRFLMVSFLTLLRSLRVNILKQLFTSGSVNIVE